MTMHASTGCALIISSVSMLIKFLKNILVGVEKLSWIEMVGNSKASPPLNWTPLFAASMSCGTLAWHYYLLITCYGS